MKLRIKADVTCGIEAVYAAVRGGKRDTVGSLIQDALGRVEIGCREVPACEEWIRDVTVIVTGRTVRTSDMYGLGDHIGESRYTVDGDQRVPGAMLIDLGASRGHVVVCASCWQIVQTRKWTQPVNEDATA